VQKQKPARLPWGAPRLAVSLLARRGVLPRALADVPRARGDELGLERAVPGLWVSLLEKRSRAPGLGQAFSVQLGPPREPQLPAPQALQ
jgi:hypothetical protein